MDAISANNESKRWRRSNITIWYAFFHFFFFVGTMSERRQVVIQRRATYAMFIVITKQINKRAKRRNTSMQSSRIHAHIHTLAGANVQVRKQFNYIDCVHRSQQGWPCVHWNEQKETKKINKIKHTPNERQRPRNSVRTWYQFEIMIYVCYIACICCSSKWNEKQMYQTMQQMNMNENVLKTYEIHTRARSRNRD